MRSKCDCNLISESWKLLAVKALSVRLCFQTNVHPSSLEQMESVRDQQEAIARRHFELGAEQDLHCQDGLILIIFRTFLQTW